jgi:hypothetical protein
MIIQYSEVQRNPNMMEQEASPKITLFDFLYSGNKVGYYCTGYPPSLTINYHIMAGRVNSTNKFGFFVVKGAYEGPFIAAKSEAPKLTTTITPPTTKAANSDIFKETIAQQKKEQCSQTIHFQYASNLPCLQ